MRLDAGKDIYAAAGSAVVLNARLLGASQATATFSWSQLDGPEVQLTATSQPASGFTAPEVVQPARLLLQVTAVTDDGHSYRDSLRVNVYPETALRRLEAEAGQLTGLSAVTQRPGFSGTGYVTGFRNENQYVTWTITTQQSGSYDLRVGYYSEESKGFNLTVNGKTYGGVMPAASQYAVVSAGRFHLDAGTHEFRLGGGWGWYDVDYLELIPLAEPASPQAPVPAPANPQASTEARALYQYLLSQYGRYTLSGQQDLAGIETVFNKTGLRPAIYSFDLLNYSSLTVSIMGLPARQTEDFIERIQQAGHIASLLWHWHSPLHAKSTVNPCPSGQASCWWNSFYTQHTNFNLGEALANTGSAEYQALIRDIDDIAVQLKKVQAADIPVLWRPLHEADGRWFWWGASGGESFKTLWRLMHQRLTHHHQIHNLLWVWTNEDPDWYPGDDVVDIVSIDAYPSDKRDLLTRGWDMLFERFDGHKLIALTEFGGVPFIEQMQQQGVWWSYFASWVDGNDLLGPNKMTEQELRDIYTSDAVLTLEDLP